MAMASLTNFRLAPLTQRYLAMSTWRTDKRDRYVSHPMLEMAACSPATQARQVDHRIVRPPWEALDTCRPSSATTRQTNTPRSLTSDNYLSSEILVKPSTIHQDDIIIQNCQTVTKRDSCRYRPHRCKHSLIQHAAASYRSDLYRISSMHLSDSTLGALCVRGTDSALRQAQEFTKLISSCKRRSYEYGRNNHRKSNSYSDSLFALLGVMALFGRPSPDEIEEERARLTDEQKIKKMKPVEIAIARGVLSMCDQNFSRANEFFHEALHLAQDEDDDERESLILNLIASNYFEGGDFQNAEKLFIDLMKRMIAQEVAPTALPILELSLKLASIYSKSPQTQEKALKGFKFVISSLLSDLDEIVSNIEGLDVQELSAEKKDELALLGWSYDWFAKHLLMMNDYRGAASMFKKAYEISEKVLGPLHDQTLILLNDIGTTLAMSNSPDEGKTFIKRAVDGAITNQSRELASFYVNLGLVNLKLRNLEEAKKNCEYSMELAKKNREHYNSQEIIELSKNCLQQIRRILEREKQ